jgi:hypothetical protein
MEIGIEDGGIGTISLDSAKWARKHISIDAVSS